MTDTRIDSEPLLWMGELVPPDPGSVEIDYEAIGKVSGDYGAEIVGD